MIFEVIVRARQRLLCNAIAGEAIRALSTGIGTLVLVLLLGTDILSHRWIILFPSIAFVAGVLVAWCRRPDAYAAAQLLDSRLRLPDTLSTAVFFARLRPPRTCDEYMKKGQREQAMRAAATVDVRAALPLRVPRGMWVSAMVLALLAAALLDFRYHFEGKLDLRRPAITAVLQLLHASKMELAKIQQRLQTPKPDWPDSNRGNDDAESPQDSDSTSADGNSNKKENAYGEANAAVKRERSAPLGNQADQEDTLPEEGKGGNSQSAPSERGNGDVAQQQSVQSASTETAADQAGSNSTLFSKVSDTMANLLSALKPQSGGGQPGDKGRNTASSGDHSGKSEADARQVATALGSHNMGSPGDDGQQDATMSASGKSADAHGQPYPGSAAGSQDGSKQIQLADQLEAMGKISVILGKRSKDLSGTVSVEVKSGSQELKVAYAARNVEHGAADARNERDQIPLVLEDYVEQYFRNIAKANPHPPKLLKRH